MPSNGQFGFSVLVGSKPLPEYQHPEDNTRVLVESVLWSPVTYWLPVKEYCKASEEIETQDWPVTPYEIKVYVEPACHVKYHYKVFVDGVQVDQFWLSRGESKIISGFQEDGESYREFLFSLPRFANNEADRVGKERSLKVGKIEVISYETTFSHIDKQHVSRVKKIGFDQANKKDVLDVTEKKYTMATTKAGRLQKREKSKPYNLPREVSIWNIGDEVKKIHMEYHMTQTLLDWGIQPIRPMWPEKDKGAAKPLKSEN